MAFWAAAIRTLSLVPAFILLFTNRIPNGLSNMYEAAYAPEVWISKQIGRGVGTVPDIMALTGLFALVWLLTFVVVWIVLQIAALFVRPRPAE